MDGISKAGAIAFRPSAIQIPGQSQVLTLTQAAAYLQISKSHLSNVIGGRVSGVPYIRHARIGRKILIKREWADEWLETSAPKPPHQC
jgi:excisionase family DNA binding protein